MSFPFNAASRGLRTAFGDGARVAAIALAAILMLAGSACAADASLSLPEAQRIAVARTRQLPAQDFAIAASREQAAAASQLPDPVLKFGVDNLPVTRADRFSLTSDFMTMRRIGVMQEFTSAEKRRLRADHYEREADRLVAEKDKTTAAIERDTALAWLDLYFADAMGAVVAEQGEQAKAEILAAEGAYRGGRGSQAEVFAARSAVAAFDDRASETGRRIRNARTMLTRWVGDASGRPLGGLPDTAAIRLDPATLDTALAHHPQIAVLARAEEVARSDAKLAQANKKPDWTVEVAYQQRGPAYSNMISLGVSVPLQWDRKHRQDRELASKLALVEQASAERDEMLREHVAETRAMLDEWQNDRERHARYQRELIPLAKERTEAVLAAYRGGKSSLADVLAARRNEIDVRLQSLQLEAETARLWAQLNFLFPTTQAASHAAMPANTDQK